MSLEEKQDYIDEMQVKINQRLVLIEQLKKNIQLQKLALEKTKKILLAKLESVKSL